MIYCGPTSVENGVLWRLRAVIGRHVYVPVRRGDPSLSRLLLMAETQSHNPPRAQSFLTVGRLREGLTPRIHSCVGGNTLTTWLGSRFPC